MTRFALTLTSCLVAFGLGASVARAQDDAPPDTPPEAPADAPEAEDSGKAGHGFVEFNFGFYNNDDNGDGNPFLDEQETVIEPVLVAEVGVTDWLTLTAQLSYDLVSSASIERLSKYPQQSGASADNYIGLTGGARVDATENLHFGANASYSLEYDYNSLGFGGNLSLDFNDDNTILSFGGNVFLDTVDVIRFNGSDAEGTEDRTTFTLTLGLYQILSPTIHMSAGYSFTHQDGFLETAFNAVVLEDPSDTPNPNLDNMARGVEVTEESPDQRLRHAFYGQVRKYFDTGTSVELGGRFYVDDWGVVSESIELRLYQWVVPEVFRIRVRYRFYNQSAADHYQEHFYVPPGQRATFVATEDRTQDSDLGEFISNTVGIKLTWYVREGASILDPGLSLEAGFDYVLRSDGIDQMLATFAIRLEF